MKAKNNDFIIKMVNKIRQDAPDAYKMAVPYVKAGDGIQVLANPLFTNELVYNTFYTGITNMIYKTVFTTNAVFSNPLEPLKKGNTELGYDIREIANDLLEEHNYQLTDALLADVLKLDPPTVMQCIHRVNRQVYYKVSITMAEMELAVTSWDDLANMFVTKAELLYNSNYVGEFEWAKDLLRMGVQNGLCPREEITAVTSEATGKAMVKAIKNAVTDFKYPSVEYTGIYNKTAGVTSITVWADPQRTVLVIPSRTLNELDTDVLAVAFNVDKLAFKTERVFEVDSLGYFYDYRATNDTTVTSGKTYYEKKADGTYAEKTPTTANPKTEGLYERWFGAIDAFVFDERYTQIYDKRVFFASNEIASFAGSQRYLHVWQTYSLSPFCDARCLFHEVDADDIPTDYAFYKYFDESENSSTDVTISDL